MQRKQTEYVQFRYSLTDHPEELLAQKRRQTEKEEKDKRLEEARVKRAEGKGERERERAVVPLRRSGRSGAAGGGTAVDGEGPISIVNAQH